MYIVIAELMNLCYKLLFSPTCCERESTINLAVLPSLVAETLNSLQ